MLGTVCQASSSCRAIRTYKHDIVLLFAPAGLLGGWLHPNIEFATRTLGIGLDYYLTREQVAKTWGETKRVFLVIEGSALAEWKAYLGLSPEPSNPIGRCGSRVILVNR